MEIQFFDAKLLRDERWKIFHANLQILISNNVNAAGNCIYA
jgi:hypothetical protein